MTQYLFRGCGRCGGDLYIDNQYGRDGDWICLQCGRYRYRQAPRPAVNDFWEHWLAQVTGTAAGPSRSRD